MPDETEPPTIEDNSKAGPDAHIESTESNESATKIAAETTKNSWWRRAWKSIRKNTPTFALIVSMVALGVTVYQSRNQYNLARQQIDAAENQVAAARTQYQIAQDSQVTDRYFRAVSMLGSEQVDLRIGAMDELLEISNEPGPAYSSVDFYKSRVVRLLTTFADTHSRNVPCLAPDVPSIEFDVQKAVETVGNFGFLPKEIVPENDDPDYATWDPRLFSRSVAGGASHCWKGIRLSNIGFSDISFQNIAMPEALLTYTFLSNVDLNNNFLSGITVRGGHLTDSHLDAAIINDSTFVSGHDGEARVALNGTSFFDARLCDSTIEADIMGVDFRKARLFGADLSQASSISSANFTGALYDLTTQWPTGFHPPGDPVERASNCR